MALTETLFAFSSAQFIQYSTKSIENTGERRLSIGLRSHMPAAGSGTTLES
jgi:hypothetical protein